ncbi:putative and chromosomal integration site [Escherichia coli P0304777.15]|nr:putative and chromosomal integration site [Escherichia coli P0304777.15]
MGFAGVLRGKKVRTTVAAGGRVNRQFVAVRPDQLWGGFYLRQHMAGLRLCGVYH